jgi:Zn-dependent protease/CBS domain-containing protein
MKSWTIYLGKFFGVEVFIHWTFWILIVWIFLMHWQIGNAVKFGFRGVLFILALFVCVVLHEFGHALVARRFGVATKNITLYPIGGIASLEGMPEKPGQELLVGLAGPVVNLTIAAFLWLYLGPTSQMLDLSAMKEATNITQTPFLWSLFFANLILAVFNLLPAFPMDGGRVFRSLLSFFMNRKLATRIAVGVGQFLAIVFVFLGFFYNFWLVFIGLFIFIGAGGEAVYEQTKAALAGLKVKDALMRRFTILNPQDTLGRAVDALLNSQETEFVIVDADKPVGVLTRNAIIKGLAEKGKDAPVSDYANMKLFTVTSATPLSDFFQKASESGQSVALVMDGNSLQGLIDSENINEKLLVQEALKK